MPIAFAPSVSVRPVLTRPLHMGNALPWEREFEFREIAEPRAGAYTVVGIHQEGSFWNRISTTYRVAGPQREDYRIKRVHQPERGGKIYWITNINTDPVETLLFAPYGPGLTDQHKLVRSPAYQAGSPYALLRIAGNSTPLDREAASALVITDLQHPARRVMERVLDYEAQQSLWNRLWGRGDYTYLG